MTALKILSFENSGRAEDRAFTRVFLRWLKAPLTTLKNSFSSATSAGGVSLVLSLITLDHTFGYQGRSTGHMNTEQFLEQVARLREIGVGANHTRVFATHIAHHSNPTHPEMVAAASQHGYEVAYDGLTIDL